MRPVNFEYHKAESLEHAVELLAELGDEARLLAGGYSLMPMMNLRLARPQQLVDIGSLGLDTIEQDGDIVRFGGLVRHCQHSNDTVVTRLLPLFGEVTHHIAHPTIRNRGTLGGSLAHADPTGELPLMAVLHDAVILVVSKSGKRKIPAGKFFKGAFMTALEPDEIIFGLEVPVLGTGATGAFFEFSEREGDFAIASVGVNLSVDNGLITEAQIACAGTTVVPLRSAEAENFLIGRSLDSTNSEEAGRILAAAHNPPSDIRATSEYRKHLAAELTHRAIEAACERAAEGA
jgi:CO/xanthine dehydrogenase FAD-binding subunit